MLISKIREKRKKLKVKEKRKDISIHLNAEFQRIARRYKNAFLSDRCKEIGEKNRMGKTRDLFKKIRDTKGTFHEKIGTIKDRNGMDLTEAEDIKKWQGYPLQYSGLENFMDSISHEVAKSRTQLSDFHFQAKMKT